MQGCAAAAATAAAALRIDQPPTSADGSASDRLLRTLFTQGPATPAAVLRALGPVACAAGPRGEQLRRLGTRIARFVGAVQRSVGVVRRTAQARAAKRGNGLQLEVVVIGGGPAGLLNALEAHRGGAQVTLVEKRHTLGWMGSHRNNVYTQ